MKMQMVPTYIFAHTYVVVKLYMSYHYYNFSTRQIMQKLYL